MTSVYTSQAKVINTNNQRSPDSPPEDQASDSRNRDPKSVLNRIKINRKDPKRNMNLTITKGGDFNANSFDIARIQKKAIQKDASRTLNTHHRRSSEDELNVDNYENSNVVDQNTGNFTVTLRNVSLKATDDDLRQILPNSQYILRSKVENGKGEIVFSRKDAAMQAAKTLNNTILKGSKITANYSALINLSEHKPVVQTKGEIENQIPTYLQHNLGLDVKENKGEDTGSPEVEKPSIFSRIKKNH